MIRSFAPALAALALAGGAAAQQPAPAPPPSIAPAQPAPPTAAAAAEARRLITEAAAGDLFEDASEGEVPGVRHLRSGLVCTFAPGAQGNRITIYPSAMPRGDDVGCTTASQDNIVLTVYATRFPPELKGEDLMRGAVAAIRQVFPDAKPFTGQTANADISEKDAPAGMPEYLRARLSITIDGEPRLTKVGMVQVGPWTYKQRTTGPADGATDLYSEIMFLGVLREILGSGRGDKPK